MKDNVFRFRTVKWGDPERKLAMIPDDAGMPRWRIWLRRYSAYGLAMAGFLIGVGGGLLLF